jgi:hypothetical protein
MSSSATAGSFSAGGHSGSGSPDVRPASNRHRRFVLQKIDAHVLESTRDEHVLPRLRRGRPLPAAGENAEGIPEDTNHPRRPSSEQRQDLRPDETAVACLERQREHHVADHEPSPRPENPPSLGKRQLLSRVLEVVERVIRDDERRTFVFERQTAEVGNEQRHVLGSVGESRIVEPLEHPLGDVDGNKLPDARRKREREQPRARAEIDNPIILTRLGKLDDAVPDREEGRARGNFFPRLDAFVPAIGILAHAPYGCRCA